MKNNPVKDIYTKSVPIASALPTQVITDKDCVDENESLFPYNYRYVGRIVDANSTPGTIYNEGVSILATARSYKLFCRIEIHCQRKNDTRYCQSGYTLKKFTEWFQFEFLCDKIHLHDSKIRWYQGYGNLKKQQAPVDGGTINPDCVPDGISVPSTYWSYNCLLYTSDAADE